MAENYAESLTENQGKALSALLVCPSVEAASRRCGLSPRTLFRFLQDPDFSCAYAEARRRSVSQTTTRLTAAGVGAVGALEEIAADKAATASARVSAARALLEFGIKAQEREDLESRVAALERIATEGVA